MALMRFFSDRFLPWHRRLPPGWALGNLLHNAQAALREAALGLVLVVQGAQVNILCHIYIFGPRSGQADERVYPYFPNDPR